MSGISNVGMARQIRLVKDVQELRSAQHQRPPLSPLETWQSCTQHEDLSQDSLLTARHTLLQIIREVERHLFVEKNCQAGGHAIRFHDSFEECV